MIPKVFVHSLENCAEGFFLDNCATNVRLSEVAEINIGSKQSVVATLGFTGDLVKGALMVVAQADSLRASHPMTSMGAEVKDSDLSDWSGEIANQILGRFKNSLLPYGVNLGMSVPTVVTGSSMQLGTIAAERVLRGVRSDSGLLFGLALVVAFVRGFDASVIDKTEPNSEIAKKEGEGLLF